MCILNFLYSHSNSSQVIPPLPIYTTFCLFFFNISRTIWIPKYVCICDLPLKQVHLNRRYLIEEMVLSFPAANTWILSGVVCTAFLHAVTTRLSLHTQTPGCVQKTFVLIYHIKLFAPLSLLQ